MLKYLHIKLTRQIAIQFFCLILVFINPVFSLGWDTISPTSKDNQYFWHLDGFITYTYTDNQKEFDNWRHSYFWTHLTGGYELLPNFWVSSWINIEKFSFSENYNILSLSDFNTFFMPQITYSNLYEFQESPENHLLLHANFGTLGNITHSKGLLYSDFTGMGTHVKLSYNNLSMEFNQLGYGYYAGDDVSSLVFYPFKKFFGAGSLLELNGIMGDRIVPGINFELSFFDQLRFYGEGAVNFTYNPSSIYKSSDFMQTFYNYLYFSPYTYSDSETSGEKLTIDYYEPYFSDKFSINKGTLAGLIGLDWKFSFPDIWKLNGSLVNQIRYYGKEHIDYYMFQSYNYFSNYNNNSYYSPYDFGYYRTIANDQKYNNQPSNYYIYPGQKVGFYLRQEFEINPFHKFFLKVRNEFLWVFATINDKGVTSTRQYGNDLFKVNLSYRLKDHVEFGIQVSNILIGYLTPYGEPITNPGFKQDGFYLQASQNPLFDFYCHYFFN